MKKRIILASASPRRRKLLSWAGVDFETAPCDIDETVKNGEQPVEYARRLAKSKAEASAEEHTDEWILSADTIVVTEGVILGKPEDRSDAESMLTRLSGRVHQVVTAFCLLNSQTREAILDHVVTDVEFRNLSSEDIKRYIDSGEVWDKAGAYAIQGVGSTLVKHVRGSYTNVVGLPVAEVLAALRRLQIVNG